MQTNLIIGLLALNLTACASFTSHREPNQETKVTLKDGKGGVKEAPAQATSTGGEKEMTRVEVGSDAEAQAHATEVKEAVAAAAQHIQDTHGKAPREAGPVPAEKAFGWLKNGNTRFVRGTFRNDGASAADRRRVSALQRPHSAVYTCSDSRVSPEIVFDQKLGEIYVVRTGELILDKNVQESLEYSVGTLGTNLVVIMGSDSCGDLTAAEGLANELLERSAILRDAVASGDVKIVKAAYSLEAGNVEFR
ncbi:carbonic anhydrase [Bdellovibrio bacteriovorus]|uniref:carbonic anhydrase n=1 Tax=Bdellovibrio bacteriovorus str. Tiberius TaxID=1069642 RepID=K7YNM7_BDEBC|nr:carbonic anhydrase [Bdellovibrio bacteriovorus]AFY01406.1 putative carbonic anhydrase [Bdellovibrio bacteriovorus str. Tiberius]